MPTRAPMTTMPFGKFKGFPIANVETAYLEWVITIARDPLLQAVLDELDRRSAGPVIAPYIPPVAVVLDIIETGRRTLAKRVHPDTGPDSDPEQMVAINRAADWLITQHVPKL